MTPDVEQLLPPEENVGPIPEFNADRLAREYTAQDVAFIMDRMLASQVAFHEVSPLSVSVYPCLWLQPQHAAQFTSAIAQPLLADRPAQQALLLALAAACSATLTSVNLVYQELIKYNIVEMEDFISDKAGLTVLDTSLLPESAVASVQRAQQRLCAYRSDTHLGEQAVDSLCLRLSLLEHLITIQALLANLPANILEIMEHFDQHAATVRGYVAQLVPSISAREPDQTIWPLHSPNIRDAPSERAASTFDVWTYRRLIAPVPVRPRVLPSPARMSMFFSVFLDQLQDAVSRLLPPGDPDHLPVKDEHKGYPAWIERLSHAVLAVAGSGAGCTEQDVEVPGYARSIQLTALCSSSQGYAINATRTLDWLGYSFLALGAGITMEDVAYLMQAIDFDDQQIALVMEGCPLAAADATTATTATTALSGPSSPSAPLHYDTAQLSAHHRRDPPPRPPPAPQLQQPIGPRLRDILSRLPGLVIADLHVMGQHPTRAHRNLASGQDLLKMATTLAELIEQAETHALSARPFLPVLQRLHLALLAFYQLGALHVPHLGLQVELYPKVPSSDSDAPSAAACAVWLAAALAAHRATTLERLLLIWPAESSSEDSPVPPDKSSVEDEWQLMKALAAFHQACFYVRFACAEPCATRVRLTPARCPVPCEQMTYLYVRAPGTRTGRAPRPMGAEVRATLLAQRLRWLKGPGPAVGFGGGGEGPGCASAEARYEASCAASRELIASGGVAALLEHAQAHLQRARLCVRPLLSQSASPTGADEGPAQAQVHKHRHGHEQHDVLWTLSHGRAALARTLAAHADTFLAQLAESQDDYVAQGIGTAPAWAWAAGTWVPSRQLYY